MVTRVLSVFWILHGVGGTSLAENLARVMDSLHFRKGEVHVVRSHCTLVEQAGCAAHLLDFASHLSPYAISSLVDVGQGGLDILEIDVARNVA